MQRKTKKIFVTGGNGFLGSRTIEQLIRKGYSVRCLLRKESDHQRLENFLFETEWGDIRDPEALRRGAQECDAIIHLAGPSSWEHIRQHADQLESIIVEGTRNVLTAAKNAGVKRTVVVSSTVAINGSKDARIFNEDCRYELAESTLQYSRAKSKAESIVHEYVSLYGLDALIVNPCEIYGPEDIGMVTARNLVGFLTAGPALVCSGGTAVAHVDDIARGIILAYEKGKKGDRYILGGDNLTLKQIAKTVRKLAGKSPHVISLPNRAVFGICKGLNRLGLPSPISLDVLEYASRYWFMDSSKAQRELGYSARPSREVFSSVVQWLIDTDQVKSGPSFRYGGGQFDLRRLLIRTFCFLQRKRVVVLDGNPKLCGEILAASDTKGTFLEHLFATPAWHPVYSIESMDGLRWTQLANDFKSVLAKLQWRERLPVLIEKNTAALAEKIRPDFYDGVDAEAISRLVVRIFFELLFRQPISDADETLFYAAALEWRKEIAIKGKGNAKLKADFFSRLHSMVRESEFAPGLVTYAADPAAWLSVFAQPFLISPQINISDIMVSAFHYLRSAPGHYDRAITWARDRNAALLGGVILESIRLQHPFPILERELTHDLVTNDGQSYRSGTQFFMLLDQFKQDQTFKPERWLAKAADNPYAALPFAAGPRMCLGKAIAMELMVGLLRDFLLKFPEPSLQPATGHLYSGRDNDHKSSARESLYQARIFFRGLRKSFYLGFLGGAVRRKWVDAKTTCPFSSEKPPAPPA